MLLVKHLNSLNAVREDQIVFKRIYEWEEEYAKTQEYQGFSAEQQQLFQQLLASDDQKQRHDLVFEFDSIHGSELAAAKKFYYLAGIHDALRIFNVS
jgi:hypothetical protein